MHSRKADVNCNIINVPALRYTETRGEEQRGPMIWSASAHIICKDLLDKTGTLPVTRSFILHLRKLHRTLTRDSLRGYSDSLVVRIIRQTLNAGHCPSPVVFTHGSTEDVWTAMSEFFAPNSRGVYCFISNSILVPSLFQTP